MSSLPEDIQIDIFLRLPVHSIVACKFVCSRWYNLISSSNFIKDHLNLATQNKNNHRFVFVTEEPKSPIWSADFSSISSSPETCDLFSEAIPIDCPFRHDEDRKIRILGSCHGLICVGSYIVGSDAPYNTHSDSICLWNPATREYKNIPLPSFPSNVSGYYNVYNKGDYIDRYGIIYGFGYDCNIDNYKLVKIVHSRILGSASEIHTLGSGLWKPINHAAYLFNDSSPGMLLNGALHWQAVTVRPKNPTILSFNISNETLIELSFPKEVIMPCDLFVGALDDCLCLLSDRGSCINVWMMLNYGVTESWTKQFTFTPERQLYSLKPLRCLQNGEFLIHTSSRGCILCDPNNGSIRYLEVTSKEAILKGGYDLSNGDITRLKVFSEEASFKGGFFYTESLVPPMKVFSDASLKGFPPMNLVPPSSSNCVGRAEHIEAKGYRSKTYMQALLGNQNS